MSTLQTPAAPPAPAGKADPLDALLEHWRTVPGGLLPLLHDVQSTFGCIAPTAVPRMARALCLSRAEVHGVLSFYHDFRDRASARHRLQVCQAESC